MLEREKEPTGSKHASTLDDRLMFLTAMSHLLAPRGGPLFPAVAVRVPHAAGLTRLLTPSRRAGEQRTSVYPSRRSYSVEESLATTTTRQTTWRATSPSRLCVSRSGTASRRSIPRPTTRRRRRFWGGLSRPWRTSSLGARTRSSPRRVATVVRGRTASTTRQRGSAARSRARWSL